MFYRAVGSAWVSKIGYAVSSDGENFRHDKHPILEGEYAIEKNGVEDPRVSKVEDQYFMTYTAYDGKCARLAMAESDDLKTWKKQGEVFPAWEAKKAESFVVEWDQAQNNEVAKKHWNKAGAIFPEKINDKHWMLFGDRNIWLAFSDDMKKWQAIKKPFLRPRPECFDSVHIEMGPPPIITKRGWLVLYHGIDDKRVYRLGFVLLDKENPSKILYRHKGSIFEPEESYEINGLVDIVPGGLRAMETMSKAELNDYILKLKEDHKMPSVVFCPGATLQGDELRIYYGAGDNVIGTAVASLARLLSFAPTYEIT